MTTQTWSYTSSDQHQEITIALGPNHTADTDDAIDDLLNTTLCHT
jgi:D-alanyl-D-alanine carboxypeptidase